MSNKGLLVEIVVVLSVSYEKVVGTVGKGPGDIVIKSSRVVVHTEVILIISIKIIIIIIIIIITDIITFIIIRNAIIIIIIVIVIIVIIITTTIAIKRISLGIDRIGIGRMLREVGSGTELGAGLVVLVEEVVLLGDLPGVGTPDGLLVDRFEQQGVVWQVQRRR